MFVLQPSVRGQIVHLLFLHSKLRETSPQPPPLPSLEIFQNKVILIFLALKSLQFKSFFSPLIFGFLVFKNKLRIRVHLTHWQKFDSVRFETTYIIFQHESFYRIFRDESFVLVKEKLSQIRLIANSSFLDIQIKCIRKFTPS